MKLIYILLIVLLLNGCVSIGDAAKLGIEEAQWATYSQDKQKELLANYKKINREFVHALKNSTNTKDGILNIDIYSGKVMLPPFNDWQEYTPVKFTLTKNQCRDVDVRKAGNNEASIKLRACFYNDTIYLDPSYYDLSKKHGSISIHYSPLWSSGFTYKDVTSSGYVRLKQVNIDIKQESNP